MQDILDWIQQRNVAGLTKQPEVHFMKLYAEALSEGDGISEVGRGEKVVVFGAEDFGFLVGAGVGAEGVGIVVNGEDIIMDI